VTNVRLYLVRHGQSAGNVSGLLSGQSDCPLTSLGQLQAEAVAARLLPLAPMPVYCSDLPRAVSSAEVIVHNWRTRAQSTSGQRETRFANPPYSTVVLDSRLREIDLGDYEGRSAADFEADSDLARAFADDPYGTALPGGESLADLTARVLAGVREILLREKQPVRRDAVDFSAATTEPNVGLARSDHIQKDDDQVRNVCLVTHDGPIRAILNHYLSIPPQRWWALSIDCGSISLVDFTSGWVNVRYVNATSHLSVATDRHRLIRDDR